MSVSDSAELAALAAEFVASLDNVPHQVSHLLKEIEHKDVKCQELMPKLAERELQYRRTINALPPGPWTGLSGPSSNASSASHQTAGVGVAETLERADKMAEKINSDYSRLEEWSTQKAALSQKLWSVLFAHHARLRSELARVDPKVIANIPVPPPTPGLLQPPILAALSGRLTGIGGGVNANGVLRSNASAAELGAGAGLAGLGLGADGSAGSSGAGGSSSSGGVGAGSGASGAGPSSSTPYKAGPGRRTGANSGAAGSGSAGTSGRPSTLGGGSSGPSRTYVRTDSSAEGSGAGTSRSHAAAAIDADGDTDIAEKGEGEEKDETPYCFCRQVSFGEMIGCDSDTCKIEWFHIGCVGVSKPLPATWYCEDCLKQMSTSQQKKRKRQA
ncbi:hypothetical protein V8E36_008742 [Tilletia maclaganii]